MAFNTSQLAAPDDEQVARDVGGMSPARQRMWRTLGLGAFFVALTLAMIRPSPSILAHSLPLNDGDPSLIIWTLAWGWHALVTNPIHYFDGNIFWPARDTLVFSDTLGPLAPFYALLHALTGSWTAAVDLVDVGLVLVSLIGAYLLCGHLTGSIPAAVVGAVAFAFSGYATSQFGHVQLESLGLLPLAIWLLLLTLERGRWWLGLLLGLASACVVLCAEYDGVAYGAAVLTIVGLWLLWRRFRLGWGQTLSLLLAAVLGGALIAPSTDRYLYVEHHYHFVRSAQTPGLVWRDLFNPFTFSYAWRRLPGLPTFGAIEGHLYPGITVLALAAVGGIALIWLVVRSRRDDADVGGAVSRPGQLMLVLAAGAVCLVLSLGDSTGRLWTVLYDHVPGFSGIRVPSRLAVVTVMAIDALGAFGVAALLRLVSSRAKQLGITVVILALVVADLAVAYKWGPLPQQPAVLAASRALVHLPPGAVADLPVELDPYVTGPDMVYSTINWDPIVNGYSGFAPPDYGTIANMANAFPSAASLRYLRQLKVRYVVISMTTGGQDVGWKPAQVAVALRHLPTGACATREGDDELVVLPGGACPGWLMTPSAAAAALAR